MKVPFVGPTNDVRLNPASQFFRGLAFPQGKVTERGRRRVSGGRANGLAIVQLPGPRVVPVDISVDVTDASSLAGFG
jgi:hypothetical protein